MATLLLLAIYIAFIGLGLPDSLFGAAWPAIYSGFNLPFSFGSFVTFIVSCGTTISSVFSAKIINKFGTNKVTAISTAMTAAALFGFAYSGNFLVLCLCAVPLGLGAGSIDTALNNYVAVHYSAKHMSFLHCFYGIGVSMSPYILSLVISGNLGWQGGYRIAACIQMMIALILFASIPLWKKVHGTENEEEQEIKVLSLKEIIRIPGVKLMWSLFICSCAIEVTCGSWGSTFLVEYKSMSAETAAGIIMFYYIGIAIGRLLSGIFATKLHSWKIIKIGQCVLGIALILLLLPMNGYFVALALFMVGLGNGPLFPNFNYLTPENFGEDISPSIIGTQMAAASIAMMIAPIICGMLAQVIGMSIFPVYLLIFFASMIITMVKVTVVLINRKVMY